MNLWTFLTATENFTNSELIVLNKVEDKELNQQIKDLIALKVPPFHKVRV